MDADPYEGMSDGQVLEVARGHLRREASLPPHSLARIAAAQQYDRAKAELDRRLLAQVSARLDALGGRDRLAVPLAVLPQAR